MGHHTPSWSCFAVFLALFFKHTTTGDEDGILLIKHKQLTGVGYTNHVWKGQTQQEMLNNWASYTKQLDFYFLANKVKEPKLKKAVLSMNLLVETHLRRI